MGMIVIAAFRPKPGHEAALRDVLRDHMPILRKEGLITERDSYVMRSIDGLYLEVFEWKSSEAVDQAHRNPNVQKLWARFEEVCEYVSPSIASEMSGYFPNFEAVDLTK